MYFRALRSFCRDFSGAGVSAHYSDQRGKWSVDYLIRCSQDLPIEERNVFDIVFLTKHPWKGQLPSGDRSLSIHEIIRHIDRIEKADLSYPVLMDPLETVLDGYHRLVLAYLKDIPTIKVRKFLVMPRPDVEIYQPEHWT